MVQDKAKPIARWGRKATGLIRQPGCLRDFKKAELPWGQRVTRLFWFQTSED